MSSTSLLAPTRAHLELLAAHLRAGGLAAIPTETVYGLAADATQVAACRRIFEVKGRPLIDPLIVHLADVSWLERVAWASPTALVLARAFWPGPLTLVLPKRDTVDDLLTAGLPTVAVRVPGLELTRELLTLTDRPLAAPSANPFGYLSPTRPEHVLTHLGGRVPYVLDGGPCSIGLESTIIDLTGEAPLILRPGAITPEDLRAVLGQPVAIRNRGETAGAQRAPGMLDRHYSPRTPLQLFAHGQLPWPGAGEAAVFFRRPSATSSGTSGAVFWLSEDGQATTAGAQLYHLLHHLDSGGYLRILMERAPEDVPLAAALNDRLQRAAATGS